MKMKRVLLAATLVFGLIGLSAIVSYALMLERQESSFWLFMRAVVEASLDSSGEALIGDQSGRFLVRGTQTDFFKIASRKGWRFADQMGASITFQDQTREFAVDCHQYTSHFIVCKKI